MPDNQRTCYDRRATYRLYPTPPQEAALQSHRETHRLLYNAALEQRKAACWPYCSLQRVSLVL
jgi:Helix-turn-helix domain